MHKHQCRFYAPERIITDAGHEADLMINENERRIFGGEGLVGADLISHYVFLFELMVVSVSHAR